MATLPASVVATIRGWADQGIMRDPPPETGDWQNTRQGTCARTCAEIVDAAGDRDVLNCFYLAIAGDFCGVHYFVTASPIKQLRTFPMICAMVHEIAAASTAYSDNDRVRDLVGNL